jgi:hypothetical protein
MNDNHDDRGKFSSGPGSAGGKTYASYRERVKAESRNAQARSLRDTRKMGPKQEPFGGKPLGFHPQQKFKSLDQARKDFASGRPLGFKKGIKGPGTGR